MIGMKSNTVVRNRRFLFGGLVSLALIVALLASGASVWTPTASSSSLSATEIKASEVSQARLGSSRFTLLDTFNVTADKRSRPASSLLGMALPMVPDNGTFSGGAITINSSGAASPYPSTIAVSGLTGTITNLTVTISNFSHSFPDDVDMLLVSPDGRKMLIWSDAGSDADGNPISPPGVTITLDDTAANSLPDTATLTSGSFKPANYSTVQDVLAVGAPAGPYFTPAPGGGDTLNSVYSGANPNGTWSLYVSDDSGGDAGLISGWSLNITTASDAPTTTTVSSSLNPSLRNQAVTFTSTTTDGANPVTTGSVTFKDGANNLVCTQGAQPRPLNVSGQATCTVAANGFTEDNHIITAFYSGAAGFGAGSGTVTQVVNCPTTVSSNTFTNPCGITIPTVGTNFSTPYPSRIFVSGFGGPISKVTLTLTSLSHTDVPDVDILLIGPQGQKFVPMSDVGSSADVSNITLTLDDAAASSLPIGSALSAGTFKPTNSNAPSGVNDTFPNTPPGTVNYAAPDGSATFASVYNGTVPNGTWSLFVLDDIAGDGGSIASWSLTITASALTVTTTTVVSSQNPSLRNQPVTFTSTTTNGATPVTTGSVTFKEGANNLTCTQGAQPRPLNGSGQATCTVAANGFTEGDHTIDAFYGGDATFAVSSGSVIQQVDNATIVNGNMFCNPGAITIHDNNSISTPYPSRIFGPTTGGSITSLTLTLNSLSHTDVQDVDMLLIGPLGQKFVVLSDVGAGAANNITLTLADAAGSLLPTAGALSSGTFKPTNGTNSSESAFPNTPAGTINHPAPTGIATFGSIYAGTNPTGTWRLYVLDDTGSDGGSVAGGWCLNFTLDLFDTTTTLASNLNPSNNGEQVTFTATVNETPVQGSANPTGTVDFIDTSNGNAVVCNDVAVTASQAQCQTSTLTAGTHNIRADYSGDGNFDPSQSAIVEQVVIACTANPIVTSTADSGAGTLRQALADVCAGTTITFNIAGAGPHTISLTTAELAVTKNVTINNNSGESITINGNNASSCVQYLGQCERYP